MNDIAIQVPINSISRWWLVKIGAVILGTIVLLTGLFFKAEAVSPRIHINYTQQLRDLKELDTKIDSEVLAIHVGLSRNFDALASYVKQVTDTSTKIINPPKFLLSDDLLEVAKYARELQASFQHKDGLIALFKRKSAILKNSLSYFQNSSEYFLHTNKDPKISGTLERYVRQMMFYIQTPDQKHSKTIQSVHQQLAQLPKTPETEATINNLLLHGTIMQDYLPQVNQQIRDFLRVPTAAQQEKLARLYAKAHSNAVVVAQQFRTLLYTFAVLLTAFLAYTFINLDMARRSLARAHQEVTERYLAQKSAEKQLRLHDTAFLSAHEAIVLTDAEGIIMDVNPAFTRITGYTRDEAIGQNPRVLKSGRHDDEFYRTMWKRIIDTGSWQGEIWNRNKSGEIYPEILSITTVYHSQNEVSNFVGVFTDISLLKEQEKQLHHMAYYDVLTKLPNRILLIDRITQAVSQTYRTDTIMAVCYLDLDGFKPINDAYGQNIGDRILLEMTNRFKKSLRGGDTVARIGGDEFVFVLVGLEKIEEYEQAVQRLMQRINQPIAVNGERLTITASIGVTLYPNDNNDADTLLRHADQSMYLAKQKGKNGCHLFNPEQDSFARTRHEKLSRIESALNNNELVLYYQPKYDLRKAEVVGMEALIRWQHPERGLLPPGEFIPFLEESDLMIDVGKWTIETALSQMEQWQSIGLELQVSVNVASLQLQEPGFVDDLKDALARHPNVNPTNLELEVLETAALEDIVNVFRILEECKEFGVSFALDDFGTGYSSLTYLKRLPASTLKIDLSFVRDILTDPGSLAIVHGILGLATAFQRKAIAEGMETFEHGKMLMQLGCRYVQGYGVSKPMPAGKVSEWIKNWRPDPTWDAQNKLYWDDADYPIFAAEVEMHKWINILIRSVNEGQPIGLKKIGDHHFCHFGQWYYDRGMQRYHAIDAFKNIEKSHRQVHKIAEQMDVFCKNGQNNKAKQLIPDLIIQRDKVLERIQELSSAVALEYKPHSEPGYDN